MKSVSEYRDEASVRDCVDAIAILVTQSWSVKEVYGGTLLKPKLTE